MDYWLASIRSRLSFVVKFDAGPSWSGLMPISGAANETRKLFFWWMLPELEREHTLTNYHIEGSGPPTTHRT